MRNKRYAILFVLLLLLFSSILGCASTELDVSYEEAVANDSLDVTDEFVDKVMLINEGIDEDQVIALAEKTAQELKEEYPDHIVNVQAVQDGVNIADITLE